MVSGVAMLSKTEFGSNLWYVCGLNQCILIWLVCVPVAGVADVCTFNSLTYILSNLIVVFNNMPVGWQYCTL